LCGFEGMRRTAPKWGVPLPDGRGSEGVTPFSQVRSRGLRAGTRSHECERCTHECVRHVGQSGLSPNCRKSRGPGQSGLSPNCRKSRGPGQSGLHLDNGGDVGQEAAMGCTIFTILRTTKEMVSSMGNGLPQQAGCFGDNLTGRSARNAGTANAWTLTYSTLGHEFQTGDTQIVIRVVGHKWSSVKKSRRRNPGVGNFNAPPQGLCCNHHLGPVDD
jgi:hypothetical protein